jgi:hypothetical protein
MPIKPDLPPQPDGHVILFEHSGFFGAHKHVFRKLNDLHRPGHGDDPDMNDKTSAIVILEGSWEFFRDKDFENTLGTLDPGLYPSIDQLGPKSNDSISSLRPVNSKEARPKTK